MLKESFIFSEFVTYGVDNLNYGKIFKYKLMIYYFQGFYLYWLLGHCCIFATDDDVEIFFYI